MSFLFLRLKTKIFFWTSSSSSFFFFFPEFKLGFKKKGGQVHDEGVQICIIGGSKQFFFNIIYIYIYKFGLGGSFEPSNYIVPPPYSVISFQFSVKKAVSKQTHSFDFFFFF